MKMNKCFMNIIIHFFNTARKINDERKTCNIFRQLYVFLITSCKRIYLTNFSYEKMKSIEK
jgi:hypothetical protein